MNICYKQRQIVLTTKHAKESVIKPLFQDYLDAEIVTYFADTDQFGTFTGEVPRVLTPIECARQKAKLGINATKNTLAIASEGSFGPDSINPFIPVNRELLLFTDVENNIEIIETSVTAETNFAKMVLREEVDFEFFINQVKYPTHGVILKVSGDEQKIYKDIKDFDELKKVFINLLSNKNNKIEIETDMRAFSNPTRMKHIAILAAKLAKRLSTNCNVCGSPGWGVVSYEDGLECENCSYPTTIHKYSIHSCIRCKFTVKELIKSNSTAPATFCPECNP